MKDSKNTSTEKREWHSITLKEILVTPSHPHYRDILWGQIGEVEKIKHKSDPIWEPEGEEPNIIVADSHYNKHKKPAQYTVKTGPPITCPKCGRAVRNDGFCPPCHEAKEVNKDV
jgi:hypothetical protein